MTEEKPKHHLLILSDEMFERVTKQLPDLGDDPVVIKTEWH